MGKIILEKKIKEDLSLIHRDFFQKWDLSLMLSQMKSERAIKIGEGFHFESFLIHDPSSNPLFVAKRAKSTFLKKFRSFFDLKDWSEKIKQLSQDHVLFIPPIATHVNEQEQLFLMAMPFCDLFAKDLLNSFYQTQWDLLQSYFNKTLQKYSSKIDDYMHLGLWDDIPLLMDLSDLNFTKNKNKIDCLSKNY